MAYVVCGAVSDAQYQELLRFALSYSEWFCVSTFKTHKKDLKSTYFDFFQTVEPYAVDQYGYALPQHYVKGQKFHLFRLHDVCRDLIAQHQNIWAWALPDLPEDLSFLKGKKVWFNAITHERMILIDTDDEQVHSFINRLGIQLRKM